MDIGWLLWRLKFLLQSRKECYKYPAAEFIFPMSMLCCQNNLDNCCLTVKMLLLPLLDRPIPTTKYPVQVPGFVKFTLTHMLFCIHGWFTSPCSYHSKGLFNVMETNSVSSEGVEFLMKSNSFVLWLVSFCENIDI